MLNEIASDKLKQEFYKKLNKYKSVDQILDVISEWENLYHTDVDWNIRNAGIQHVADRVGPHDVICLFLKVKGDDKVSKVYMVMTLIKCDNLPQFVVNALELTLQTTCLLYSWTEYQKKEIAEFVRAMFDKESAVAFFSALPAFDIPTQGKLL